MCSKEGPRSFKGKVSEKGGRSLLKKDRISEALVVRKTKCRKKDWGYEPEWRGEERELELKEIALTQKMKAVDPTGWEGDEVRLLAARSLGLEEDLLLL